MTPQSAQQSLTWYRKRAGAAPKPASPPSAKKHKHLWAKGMSLDGSDIVEENERFDLDSVMIMIYFPHEGGAHPCICIDQNYPLVAYDDYTCSDRCTLSHHPSNINSDFSKCRRVRKASYYSK